MNNYRKNDFIELKNINAKGRHGLYIEEKKKKQLFIVDLKIYSSFMDQTYHDTLKEGIDYSEVENLVVSIIESESYNLIEKLIERIAGKLFITFNLIEELTLTLYKPEAPLNAKSKVSITINRHKTDITPCRAWIGLGSNKGNRRKNIQKALDAINALPETHLKLSSSFTETIPIGESKKKYINGACMVRTRLKPTDLLNEMLKIETSLGRKRKKFWAERTIDLDLLFYENWRRNDPFLQLPHPRINERDFVLAPLKEIKCPFLHLVKNS